MKKVLRGVRVKACLLFLIILAGWGHQKAYGYLEIGYRVGTWLNPGGLNTIIREYNTQNPWQKFKPVHIGLGGRVIFGAHTESVSFFAGLKWLRNTQTSTGTNPTSQVSTTKRLVVHYGGIIFGMHTSASQPISGGIELNPFNYFVLRAQEGTAANVKSSTGNEIVNRVNPDISLFVRFAAQHGMAGVTLIPALDLPVFGGKNDISGLRKEWKLYTPSEAKSMRGYHFSLTLSVLLGKKRD